jgi:hypothetical protein
MSNSNESRIGRPDRRPPGASTEYSSLAKAIALASGVSLFGLLIAFQADAKSELHKQLMSASLALLFGACFGGIVKMLLDQFVAEKRRRDDAAAFVANVLADLKKVYDHIERARLLIPAHQSAKTYGDEMREDVTAGVVQLRNVIRALQGRVAGVPVGLQESVRPQVEMMKDYLIELTNEFRAEYKPLADLQRFHEQKADKLAKAFAEGNSDMPPEKMPAFVWTAVERLPRLAEFMQGGPGYDAKFIGPLDAASEALRTAHADLIGHPQDDSTQKHAHRT